MRVFIKICFLFNFVFSSLIFSNQVVAATRGGPVWGDFESKVRGSSHATWHLPGDSQKPGHAPVLDLISQLERDKDETEVKISQFEEKKEGAALRREQKKLSDVTDKIKQTWSMDLRKPEHLPALEWLRKLEKSRDNAKARQDFVGYEVLTRQVSATLAGQYGLGTRSATPEQTQQIMASVRRTRDHYVGLQDPLGSLYFSYDRVACRRKMQTDPVFAVHMAHVIAADAIRYKAQLPTPADGEAFSKILATEGQSADPVTPVFIRSVTQTAMDLHTAVDQKIVQGSMSRLTPRVWKTVVESAALYARIQSELAVPALNASIFYNDIILEKERKHQEWQSYGTNKLVPWQHDGAEVDEKTGKLANPERDQKLIDAKKTAVNAVYMEGDHNIKVESLWSQAVPLTAEMKKYFVGVDFTSTDNKIRMPYDGTYVGIIYGFLLPFFDDDGDSIEKPIYLYLG
jgi:hypothetical protein